MVALNISLDGSPTSYSLSDSSSLISQLSENDPYYTSVAGSSVVLIVCSFFALLLSLPALVWHTKNRSLPAASLVFWIVLENLFNIINAIVWSDDNLITWWPGYGYCDLEIKLDIAGSLGLLGSLACMMRALAAALDTDNARLMLTTAQRSRQIALDIIYCIALPLCLAALHFVVQPFRYYVAAIAGCVPVFDPSWLSLTVFYIWPPVLCLVNAHYAILLIIRVRRYRRDFASILSSSSSGLNRSRFVRLFAAAMILLTIVIPTQAYSLYRNLQQPITTFDWGTTHNPATWNTVVFVPTYGVVFEDRWIRVGLALPVFICFGWGRDAKNLYKSWLILLGFEKCFPSLKPNNTTATSGGAASDKARHKRQLFNNSITSKGTVTSSSTPDSECSFTSHPAVSKFLSLFVRIAGVSSSISSFAAKKLDSSTLSKSTMASSNTKTSPTLSHNSNEDKQIETYDFAAEPTSTSNSSSGNSIPLAALAVRAQQRQDKRRLPSLYSLGSEGTAVGSPWSVVYGKGSTSRYGSQGGSGVGSYEDEEGTIKAPKKVAKVKKNGKTAAEVMKKTEEARAYEDFVVGTLA